METDLQSVWGFGKRLNFVEILKLFYSLHPRKELANCLILLKAWTWANVTNAFAIQQHAHCPADANGYCSHIVSWASGGGEQLARWFPAELRSLVPGNLFFHFFMPRFILSIFYGARSSIETVTRCHARGLLAIQPSPTPHTHTAPNLRRPLVLQRGAG